MVRIFAIGSVATQLFSMAMLRCEVQWARIAPVAAVGLMTMPLGLLLLRSVSPETYMVVLGTTIACYAMYMLLCENAVRVRGSAGSDLGAGAVAGFIGGFAALPVSSLAIYCQLTAQGRSPAADRAFYQPAATIIQIGLLIALYRAATASVTNTKIHSAHLASGSAALRPPGAPCGPPRRR